ncbi:phage tail tape measure protein [Lachnospiraceae bacterium OttesenSCG-928-J05]|nr:phage tail tape measure protein [Lachnospiraceae bacterium OttesenSCG-928-J05]
MASKALKGIVLELGGDTTKLDKALTGVEKESRNIQKELREVEKALKLDPKNTELLAQKQKLLTENVSATSEKLDVLKKAEAQVQEQFAKGEISEEQYRALQREIITTEEQLKKLEKAAQESNSKMADISEVTGKVGEKATTLGKNLMPVSVAIAGVGAASIAAFNEVDEGYDTIIVKTGATGEALEGLQDSMDNVFTSLPTDAETAGIAIGEVNTRFGATGETLEGLSKQFIEFAEINETDLNTAIGTTDKIMEQWGVDASQTANVLGIITDKAQATGISVDNLMNSVQLNGAVFKDMGLNMGQSVSLLAEFEANGINAETAIAGLRKAVQNAAADGKTTEQALSETIDSIKNASSETEAMNVATELFGKKGAAEMTKAIREGRFSVDDLSGSLEEYGTTVEDTFNATLDPPDKAKVALNNLKLAGSELGDSLMSTLTPILDKVVGKVKEFTEWFKNLSAGQKETIVKIAMLVAAIAPAIFAFGKINAGISAVTGGLSKLSGVFKLTGTAGKGFFAILKANPIGFIITAVMALIAVFVTMYTKCEWFRDAVNEAFASIKETIGKTIDKVKPIIAQLAESFMALMTKLQPVIEFLVTFVSSLLQGVLAMVEPLMQAVQNIIDFVSNIVSAFIALFKGDFDAAGEYLLAAAGNVLSFLGNIIMAGINFIVEFFRGFGVNIGQVFINIKDTIVGLFVDIGNWFYTKFLEAYNGVVNAFLNIGTWFAEKYNAITNVFANIGSWFSTKFREAYNAITNVFSGIGNFFSGVWKTVTGIFTNAGQSIGNAISGAFKSAMNSAFATVENIINSGIGLINGAIGVINKLPGVSVGSVPTVNLPRLAKGGILENGQAVVAEAGPEVIQMVNGRTVVTPLTSSARNYALDTASGGKGGFTQINNINSPRELSPYEIARQTRNQTRLLVAQLARG